MIIYLLRHGEAETHAASDALRQLTDRGITQVRSVVSEFLLRAPGIDMLLASPLVRARQTAGLLQEQQPLVTAEPCPLLVPDADPGFITAILQERSGQVMLVGHNPHLSRLRTWLLHGRKTADRNLGTAELVAIATDAALPGSGQELYAIRPSGVI